MNVRTMIEAAVSTLDKKDQSRMRAAMELGARFGLEAAIAKGGYMADAKETLAELDGTPKAIEPAPATL